MTLTVGSLFSGIGGLDLGLERAGMRVIWQSEIDPYASRVLAKHWPEVPNHGDIKKINWQNIEKPDVLCGGYPCQPFSQAGKRRGEEDPRHLWPWVRDAIIELRPRYAILENVRGHLSLGGVSVIGELASIGYNAEWRVISAASVGANHRRDRIIIVAYPNGRRFEQCEPETEQVQRARGNSQRARDMANSDCERLERQRPELETTGTSRSSENSWQSMANTDSGHSTNGRQCENLSSKDSSRGNDRGRSRSDIGEVSLGSSRQNPETMANTDLWEVSGRDWRDEPDRGEVFGRDNQRRGTAGYEGRQWWEIEPDVGRVAHGVPARVDRLRGLGNAVVPQVAEVIGRLVVAHYKETSI